MTAAADGQGTGSWAQGDQRRVGVLGGLRHGLSWVCGEGTRSFRKVLPLGAEYRKRAAGERG